MHHMKLHGGKKNKLSNDLSPFDNLSCDNRGSTIIVVLVTMTFLTVLASILLYLSLVNLQMKKMDKAGKANFYSAEAVMNEIRTGVQEAVSDAIKDAYTSVLISYNTTTKEEQMINFREMFFSRLYAYTIGPYPLFVPSGAAYNYDPIALATFVSDLQGVVISSSQPAVQPVLDDTNNVVGLVLKDLTVRYTSKGYETSVSSDITIKAPVLPYTSTSSKQTAIPDFAIVAKGTLQQLEASGTVSIYGNVYAGDIAVSGGGNVFNVQNAAYFISAGPVTVNGGTMSLNLNSSLWGGDIRLDTGGRITIAGDAYISNDLNLYGNLTQATLSGRYYGFGDSILDPNESSSIVINGKNTVLDMSSLRALMLAGHSFVNFGTGVNGYILMGESVSVKSNQLAYLVPDNCLISGFTNPYQYTGPSPDNATLENAVLLDQKIMNNKTLADYGITSTANNIGYIHKTIGSTNLIYFCLKFGTPEAANAYFKEYYNTNNPQVQKYLDIYSNGVVLANSSTKNLAGEAFTFNGSILGPIIDATNVPTASKTEIGNSFANLCVTLSRTESAVGITSPYDYFVNGNDIATKIASGTTVSYPSEEAAKVVVTNGNYVMNASSDSTVHIVIASGDVTVSGSYTGLILAGGKVTLLGGSSVSASRAIVADALQALLTTDDSTQVKYYQYLNPQYISPINVSTDTSGKTSIWDMNALVIYENWSKNET